MDAYNLVLGDGPLVAAAIHNGHAVRPEVAEKLAIDPSGRRHEEDPFTDELAALLPTRLIGQRSRFEFDLNRPRDQAVYQKAADCWGLEVWREALPPDMVEDSLLEYDLFYTAANLLLNDLILLHRHVVVLDFHTYNHRRDGPNAPPAPAEENPEVNLGTESLDRVPWGPLVDRFRSDLSSFLLPAGRCLDVRENVKFKGGHFSRWIHATFPGRVASIAIEFKKTFMDEWTGELDRPHFEALHAAIHSTLPGLRDSLDRLNAS